MPKMPPPPLPRSSSFGNNEWGMHVLPDDPLRDTPEKAERYYRVLFAMIEGTEAKMQGASSEDIKAAEKLFSVG